VIGIKTLKVIKPSVRYGLAFKPPKIGSTLLLDKQSFYQIGPAHSINTIKLFYDASAEYIVSPLNTPHPGKEPSIEDGTIEGSPIVGNTIEVGLIDDCPMKGSLIERAL
jgi:hypothetical protein